MKEKQEAMCLGLQQQKENKEKRRGKAFDKEKRKAKTERISMLCMYTSI